MNEMKPSKPRRVTIAIYTAAMGRPNGIAKRNTAVFNGYTTCVTTYHAGYANASEGN